MKLASSTPKFGTNPRVNIFKANPMKKTFMIQSIFFDNDHTETDTVTRRPPPLTLLSPLRRIEAVHQLPRQHWMDVKLAILKFVHGRSHQPPYYVKRRCSQNTWGVARIATRRLVVRARCDLGLGAAQGRCASEKCLAWLLTCCSRVLDT